MPNIKLLTDTQKNKMRAKYKFVLQNENEVLVTFEHYARKTVHSVNEPFFINVKPLRRKLHFTTESIAIWKDLYPKYSLIDVQQSVNILKLTYQEVTKNAVVYVLNKDGNVRVNKV